VVAALRRGVAVLSLDVDEPAALRGLADQSYDVAVLSQTLQTTRDPERVLAELARIGERVVLSVPNFGLWRHRAALALRGRMPMSDELPYPWYQTPNIHLSTLPDLEELVADLGLVVDRRVLLDERHRPLRSSAAGNLRAANAVYRVRRVG
jgi:methionine biosynthesis protein MetW